MRPAAAIAPLVLVLLTASRETLSFQLPGAGIVQSDVTTSTGSRGLMYRPVGEGPYPAVLHLHGSGDTVANNVDIAARTSAGSNPTILDSAPRLTLPILLQHGTEDSVVPYNESVLLERRLKSLGRPVEFFSYPGAGHNTLPWDQVYDRVLTFFAAHLQ